MAERCFASADAQRIEQGDEPKTKIRIRCPSYCSCPHSVTPKLRLRGMDMIASEYNESPGVVYTCIPFPRVIQ
ncbi:hypothetical protein DAI22_01g202200 [Oryza sativa Japonica Group]|nr:hypothetical protein DAI22_01g202200 [Oryza sativa Japonica Group]